MSLILRTSFSQVNHASCRDVFSRNICTCISIYHESLKTNYFEINKSKIRSRDVSHHEGPAFAVPRQCFTRARRVQKAISVSLVVLFIYFDNDINHGVNLISKGNASLLQSPAEGEPLCPGRRVDGSSRWTTQPFTARKERVRSRLACRSVCPRPRHLCDRSLQCYRRGIAKGCKVLGRPRNALTSSAKGVFIEGIFSHVTLKLEICPVRTGRSNMAFYVH